MSDWSSEQYIKFKKQRTQPSVDLINRISIDSPQSILDIGCGPGNSTAALAERFPNAEIMGIDSSEDMLKKARDTYSDMRFLKCVVPDGLDEIDQKFDLIFSNACIHWIPYQERLLKSVMEKLNDGGVFAVQIPLTDEAPFYKMLYSVIAEPKWERLKQIRNFHNLSPEGYYDALLDLSDDFELWQTTYYHIVPSFDGILEWYKGSGLRPYLDALCDDEKTEFLNVLSDRISKMYPVQKDGNVILKMPRLFFYSAKNLTEKQLY